MFFRLCSPAGVCTCARAVAGGRTAARSLWYTHVMSLDIEKELKEQRQLLEKIYISAEKTRKYYLWTIWGTIIAFVLPLIALAIVLPYFLNTYSSYLTGSI